MNKNTLSLLWLIIAVCPYISYAQSIYLDGDLSEWSEVAFAKEDSQDKVGIEITEMALTSDSDYVYFKVGLNTEINLQDNNNLDLLIDLDNNPATGQPLLGKGIDFIYEFGRRCGSLNGQKVFHNDVGLLSMPTVSSAEFELAFSIESLFNAMSISDSIVAFFRLGTVNADYAPNPEELQAYALETESLFPRPAYSIQKKEMGELRIVSYNVKRDMLFDGSASAAYSRILKAIDSDIICFQEIYDFNAQQLLARLENLGVINAGETWYACKDGPDLITVSRYPILHHEEVDGNSFVQLDTGPAVLSLFNCHLPCCDNDEGRVSEIDAMLAFLRNALEGNGFPTIPSESPYLFLGDMNLVGSAGQLNSMINGNITSNFIYGDDVSLNYSNGLMNDLKAPSTALPGVFTWYNPDGSFPAGKLDYIIYTDRVMDATNAFVLDTRLMPADELLDNGFDTDDTSIASDHLPVVADFRFNALSSAADRKEPNFRLYPNPSASDIFIDTTFKVDRYVIRDSAGRIVYSRNESSGNYSIDVSGLVPGLYILEIGTGNTKSTQAFIKK